jgi:protocatechuate 3,4-dioxygenase beta subunit
MVSSARQAIVCILLIFGMVADARSQAAPEKNAATISGKVTIKGKGVPGIVVIVLDPLGGGSNMQRYRGATDQTGNYRIADIRPGTYQVGPVTPAFVVENDEASNSLVMAEGETLENINFSLVRGGVITGKITDSEGQPLIEQQVTVAPVEDQSSRMQFNNVIRFPYGQIATDDRGIYRAFGLRQGKYKVSVGVANGQLPGRAQQPYRETFHPAVTDSRKATVIEVTEGSETNNIDIVTGPAATTFKVTGRIVDGESGKPLANITYGVAHIRENGSESSSGGVASNADGEFKLENVLPGKYLIFTDAQKSDMRPASVTFDVIDRDITGLLIKAFKGASLSGVLVFEGSDENAFLSKLNQMPILAQVRTDTPNFHNSQHVLAGPDGSFKITGLQSGVVYLSLGSFGLVDGTGFELARVERNGVSQPGSITVKDGEQITGIRLVIKRSTLTGSIRGQVKDENGELPPSLRMSVSVVLLDDNPELRTINRSNQSVEVDARGRFVVENLSAGTYEVRGMVFTPSRMSGDVLTQVTVTENSVSEVTLTLKVRQ